MVDISIYFELDGGTYTNKIQQTYLVPSYRGHINVLID